MNRSESSSKTVNGSSSRKSAQPAGHEQYRLLSAGTSESTEPKDRSDVGLKYDDGKPPMHYLPPRALMLCASVMGYGAKKYGERNWLLVQPADRYDGASLRHHFAHLAGERYDESGLPHLAHAAVNLLMRLEKMVLDGELDKDEE